jgi:hypothetical protein
MGLTPDVTSSIEDETSARMDPKETPFVIFLAFEKME